MIALLLCLTFLAGCGGSGGNAFTESNSGGGGGGAKSASLSWEAPTTNEGGSCISGTIDLNDYRLYYNDTGNVSPTNSDGYYAISVSDQSLSCVDSDILDSTTVACTTDTIITCTYTAQNLTEGTWYFVITARDIYGNESIESNEAIKVL